MREPNPTQYKPGRLKCNLCNSWYYPTFDPVERKQVRHPLCRRCRTENTKPTHRFINGKWKSI